MPAVFAGILLSHAVHLRLALGRWQSRTGIIRRRDSLEFCSTSMNSASSLRFWLTVFSVPLWFLAAVLARPRLIRQTFGRQALVFLLGVGLLCGSLYALSWTFYPQWLLD